MYVAGIDEAGRGPVVGPMTMAVVAVDLKHLELLKDLGVTDSKLLSPSKREELYLEIKKIAKEIHSLKIDANEIDKKRETISLNTIEAKMASELINKLTICPRKLYIDCPDVNPERYHTVVYSYLDKHQELVVEHKADLNYLPVSAASIIAKVERDSHIRDLEEKYGVELGTGYPHDPKTRKFLESVIREKNIPDFVRKSWQTVSDIKDSTKQKKLF